MTQYGAIDGSRDHVVRTGMEAAEEDSPERQSNWQKYTWTSTSTLDSETIYLVVSGKKFCISRSSLLAFPHTKLGRLAYRHSENHDRLEYVFDRNSKIMTAVLDLYRTGELHLPTNLCCMSIRRELQLMKREIKGDKCVYMTVNRIDTVMSLCIQNCNIRYWEIPDDLISECCYGRYMETLRQMKIVDELDKVMVSTTGQQVTAQARYKDLVWQTMENSGTTASWVWLSIYMTFIGLSIVVVCLSTMHSLRVDRNNADGDNSHDTILDDLLNSDLNSQLTVLDTIGLIFFSVEPLVRLMVSPEPKKHAKQFLTILDFLLATNHWLCFLMEQAESLLSRYRSVRFVHAVLRALLSFRVLRIFHLARRYVKMKALLLTLRASISEILLLFLGVSIAVIIFATSIYYVEVIEGKDNFLNIPQAIWWAIITMTTVGYGDYYPVTVAGYVVGTLCALSGLLLLSMPIAIIANNFNTYSQGLNARDQRQRRQDVLHDIMNVSVKGQWDESHTNWPRTSSTKIHTSHEMLGMDHYNYSMNGKPLVVPYPVIQHHKFDDNHANSRKRRLSDGFVERQRFQTNRERFLTAHTLKPALSDRVLHLNFEETSCKSPGLNVKSVQRSNTSLDTHLSDRAGFELEQELTTHDSVVPHNMDAPIDQRLDSPDQVNYDIPSTQREKSRRRKYRQRRKTWGSLSKLCPPSGDFWSSMRDNVRLKNDFSKDTT